MYNNIYNTARLLQYIKTHTHFSQNLPTSFKSVKPCLLTDDFASCSKTFRFRFLLNEKTTRMEMSDEQKFDSNRKVIRSWICRHWRKASIVLPRCSLPDGRNPPKFRTLLRLLALSARHRFVTMILDHGVLFRKSTPQWTVT